VIVRPEDVRLARTPDQIPEGANRAPARVTDVEYMGSYRTAMLAFGSGEARGRARLDAVEATVSPGDDVIACWRPERQRVVAV
jgi:putative spermidine/putrescine transport system ATP-binding protein